METCSDDIDSMDTSQGNDNELDETGDDVVDVSILTINSDDLSFQEPTMQDDTNDVSKTIIIFYVACI